MAELPTGAYRVFERGPRSCIGKDLAFLEATIVLVAIARGFVFEKVGLSGQEGKGRFGVIIRLLLCLLMGWLCV